MTCVNAIRQVISQQGIISFATLLSQVKQLGKWTDDTIA